MSGLNVDRIENETLVTARLVVSESDGVTGIRLEDAEVCTGCRVLGIGNTACVQKDGQRLIVDNPEVIKPGLVVGKARRARTTIGQCPINQSSEVGASN
ncbi:MAG: hypothetical protein US62_C0015G0019 [Candidatus Woesebacteria bacterium GW2011_GWA1_37_8]|uniref:Uncharacterized protein n=2 Tax=Candidatus Woeseibacteriota TaxID=1752722 RepID=A0A0G0PEG2_9BACT|nr:MAG: hypothetical protein US39_C0005G0028 [Microgenomates group bacterium GW2011_GWC1_37_12b]KKQ45438.1 MAG: hypothetical protein US62_C0015G0019 [Candidatus Woesebacteria bacterium GW2011_GWA1_37_8]KKQ87641.1 MAG: hypothetical protein UT10_C0003G0045 [Candidatus Woesebacteria bacterium GW2011_GWB1_38_8b]